MIIPKKKKKKSLQNEVHPAHNHNRKGYRELFTAYRVTEQFFFPTYYDSDIYGVSQLKREHWTQYRSVFPKRRKKTLMSIGQSTKMKSEINKKERNPTSEHKTHWTALRNEKEIKKTHTKLSVITHTKTYSSFSCGFWCSVFAVHIF